MKQKFLFYLAVNIFSMFAVAQQGNTTLNIDSFVAKIEKQSNPQIIDARSPEEFALNHVEGAINFNLESANYDSYVSQLNKEQPVFIYSIQTNRSGKLAADLQKKGFKEVYDLKGGIGSWVGKGQRYYTSAKKGLSLNEYQKILSDNKIVLVDIGSRFCGACKKVKPILDSLRKEKGDSLRIVEIDLEESPQLITALKTVDAFPYIIIYNRREIVLRRNGLNDLQKDIETTLGKIE